MSIIGFTDKRAQFPEIGTLRKGAPKTDPSKPGADLDYFRFDTDDEAAHEKFIKAFGDKPRQIEIKLPYPTVDENFEAWREEYVASGLKHRCDGKNCVRWLKPDGTYSEEPIKCPGRCKQTGRLKVIIPALERFACVMVNTTSIWDIITIHQNLSALEMLCGTLRGIPMILCRREREISTPAGNGKRARRKKWLLTVEAEPDWAVKQLAAMDRAALQPTQTLALPEWNGEEDAEEIEEIATPAPDMITDGQIKLLTGVIAELETLGVAREQWRGGILSFTSNATDEIAELTNEQAAKIIHAFTRRLEEKRANAERKKGAGV